MNKERMKRAFMAKIIAALLIVFLLVAGCTTYYSAADKYQDGRDYSAQVMYQLEGELSSCVSEEKSLAVKDGLNLALIACKMKEYDERLGMWDGARRIDTIMLYEEEKGKDETCRLKPVETPDVHFLRESGGDQPLLVLEDWLSPAHVGYFLRMVYVQCMVKGYEKNGFMEPVDLWAGRWEDVPLEIWKQDYAHQLTPVKKAHGKEKSEILMESAEVCSVNWQQEQLRDESWELLEQEAAGVKIDWEEENPSAGPAVSFGAEETAPDSLFTARETRFIQMNGHYWLGYCVIEHPFMNALRDNLWMHFLVAVICFMVGTLLIGSYFRVLDQQYETELRRRSMSDAMAHEMKTPLGIIKNYSEALMEEETPEKRREYLDTIVEETDGMNRMIVQMLDLSKMEAGTYPLRLSMLSVNRIVEGILKRTEILMKPKKLRVETELAEEVPILADEKLLTESISNLLTNAVRYGEEESSIKLSLRNEGGGVRIAVENSGPRIGEKDRRRIWESFYRGDEARNRESGGNGLGLSIAANTCVLHGGSYGFENLEHGVKFWLQIPSQENRPRERKSAAGPILRREGEGLDLAGLRYTILGTILWLIPYAVIFLLWRRGRGAESDMVPYLLSIPGWVVFWIGAVKMKAAGGRRPALWTIPAVAAAGALCLCSGTLEPSRILMYGEQRLLLMTMSFAFITTALACGKTAARLGNAKLRKLLLISGILEGILLAACPLLVPVSYGYMIKNCLRALVSIGAVFNVCLWYDVYRRYHLRERS